MYKVAELEQCTECVNNICQYVTLNCGNVNLSLSVKVVGKRNKFTFMRALESSPVHCLKLRPCGKRRRPENEATAAILSENLVNKLVKGC
jgi:hypothetical protein